MGKKRGEADDVVSRFVEFQEGRRSFDTVWPDVQPIVTAFARSSLARLAVKGAGGVDGWALDDVVQQTAATLTGLGKPGAKGLFDPARAKPGLSGFRGWLWTVVDSQAVNWVRTFRSRRGVKLRLEADLACNVLSGGDEPDSFFDRRQAKIERPDLLPLLNEAIEKLPDDLRRLVRLRLDDGLSHRQSAHRVGSSAPVVGRRLKDAYEILRTLLEDGGFDIDAWLAA